MYGGNIVSWQSKKQATIARSSTKVEYKSLADATSKALWVVKVLDQSSKQVVNSYKSLANATSGSIEGVAHSD